MFNKFFLFILRLRKRRIVIAATIVGGVIISLAEFGEAIFDKGVKIGEIIGLVQTEQERSDMRAAYQLGKAVAIIGLYSAELEAAGKSQFDYKSLPDDLKGDYIAKRSTLDSMIKELRIDLNIDGFDFIPRRFKYYSMSYAATNIGDVLRSTRADNVWKAYKAGLEVKEAFILGIENQFEYDLLSAYSVEGILERINAHAERFGAEKVPRNSLTDAPGWKDADSDRVKEIVNFQIQNLASKIDKRIEDALK